MTPVLEQMGIRLNLSTRYLLGRRPPSVPWDNRDAIREELFSAERLEEHGRSLAAEQPVAARPSPRPSLAWRLSDNSAVLLAAYHSIARAVNEGQAITPAAEWVIDNYYVVERQIREVRADLPPRYYRQLPKLAGGPFAGYPRVFGIAWAFVAHTDSRFDAEFLCRFVRAYQEVQPLTIGELWAVAITLRIVLVENLRRIAERIVQSRAARHEANIVADRLLGTNGRDPEPTESVLASYAQATLSNSLAVQLLHRLRDQDARMEPVLAWIDQKLTGQGTTADEAVRREHQRQAAATVTVRNIITSMRLISDVDWADLFERMSLVDEALVAGSAFAKMDFRSRNLYRNAIEELARRSKLSELDVARRSIDAARAGGDERRRDPGFYLIAAGRPAFEAEIGFQPPLRVGLERASRALGVAGYVGAGAAVAGLVLAVPLTALANAGLGGAPIVLFGLLGLIPAVDLAVALVNRAVTSGFGARLLPALSLHDGVPEQARTLVAMPALLTSRQGVEELIERLEVHFLAGPTGDLHFALLSDWMDADAEHVEGDEALLVAAVEGIADLNRRHGAGPGGDLFLLFHRRRVWNASEERWMGWERKRGKLHELNRLLRGDYRHDIYNAGEAQPIGGRGALRRHARFRHPGAA